MRGIVGIMRRIIWWLGKGAVVSLGRLCWTVLVVMAKSTRRLFARRSTTYGSARFATLRELKKAGMIG